MYDWDICIKQYKTISNLLKRKYILYLALSFLQKLHFYATLIKTLIILNAFNNLHLIKLTIWSVTKPILSAVWDICTKQYKIISNLLKRKYIMYLALSFLQKLHFYVTLIKTLIILNAFNNLHLIKLTIWSVTKPIILTVWLQNKSSDLFGLLITVCPR